MASASDSVWAIDIGSDSLKALRLTDVRGVVEVIGFANIRHGKILSGSGLRESEKRELTAMSMRDFARKNELGKDDVIISVPSQNSFARFVNLPPVEQKRIPEIVKFEAAQQIPFDIDEVQWDWQLMGESKEGENKVGIFAIKNDIINTEIDYFSGEEIQVSYIQMAPMALYNYILYDRASLFKSENQAAVILNIGAESTDLVVCTGQTVWQRSVPMGGNAFTRAISDTFKLNFEKAEKLKRTAAMSKYARQILQAMKPVFADFSSEIQRSIGFYSNSNPNTKISGIIALGGGTKMRGLLQYLQKTLQMPVERPDSFKKVQIGQNVSAAKFHENVCDFAIVYGLGLQALGLGKIESNLLPRSVAKSMVWSNKAKYFTAAAILLLLVSVLTFARTLFDKAHYTKQNNVRQQISNIVDTARQAGDKLEAEKRKASVSKAIIAEKFELFKYRDVIPELYQTILAVLPNEKNNPRQKELYKAFDSEDVEKILQIPRSRRKQLFVTNLFIQYTADVSAAGFSTSGVLQKKGSVGQRSGFEEGYGEYDSYEEYLKFEGGGSKKPGEKAVYEPGAAQKKDEDDDSLDKAGFVVTIAGYGPYQNIDELLDPAGVKNEPNKWGFVTRLMNLDEALDANCPFRLYKKIDIQHFNLKTGQVDIDSAMPAGIGVIDIPSDERQRTGMKPGNQNVLIDPMTKEIISMVPEIDDNGQKVFDRNQQQLYQVNDHWFTINAKFLWEKPETSY